MARARGLDLAGRWGVARGAPVFVAAVEFGTEEQRSTANEELKKAPKQASEILRARLSDASSGGKARLVDALVLVAPADAVSAIVPLLSNESSAQRLHFRRALATLAGSKSAGPAVRATVEGIGRGKSGAPPDVEVEILRAAGPQLRAWKKSALPALERLSQSASFERAYRLLPHVLDLAGESQPLQAAFSAWLSGARPKGASAIQRAALSVRALEVLSESARSPAAYQEQVMGLFASDNMRVRRSALIASIDEDLQAPEQEVLRLLARDDWPEVRAAAARATTAFEPRVDQTTLERTLARRLRKDAHPSVRAAVARALGGRSGEHSRKALRRAFEKDESHEVRAEAALALGDLCDTESLAPLTAAVRELSRGPVGDGPIVVGLAAVSALAKMAPADLDKRVKPALGDSVSAVLKNQVSQRLLAADAARQSGKASSCQSAK
jgi:hypothetical protein